MPFQTLLLLVIGKKKQKQNKSPFYLWSSKVTPLIQKYFLRFKQPTSNLSSAHACKLIGELNELLNVAEPVLPPWHLHLGIFHPCTQRGTFDAEQPPSWLWITHPSHPAELPLLQPHRVPSALHVFHGMFPPLSSWRRLERPCSFPGAVSVFSPFSDSKVCLEDWGKKLPLKGLLCSLLGVGREKVFLRDFQTFSAHFAPRTSYSKPLEVRLL